MGSRSPGSVDLYAARPLGLVAPALVLVCPAGPSLVPSGCLTGPPPGCPAAALVGVWGPRGTYLWNIRCDISPMRNSRTLVLTSTHWPTFSTRENNEKAIKQRTRMNLRCERDCEHRRADRKRGDAYRAEVEMVRRCWKMLNCMSAVCSVGGLNRKVVA